MLVALIAIFAASRAVLYALFPFRIDFLPWLNQLLDVDLLKYELWTSLWQWHATPPLYNLYVGLLLKTFPEWLLPFVFQALHFGLGLGMVVMVYAILMHLKVGTRLAFVGGLTVIAHPILFRFEIIPFYTYPLAFLITLSVFALVRFLESGKRTWLIAFLLVPLIILLTRNFFHIIVYFLPIATGFCYLVYKTKKPLFKTAVIISLIFFIIGLAPSVKNQVEYGIFSSSTWQGMQLFSMTRFVPKDKIDVLINEGVVTPLVLVPRFQNPDLYYDYYHELVRSGNPALNALFKSEGDGEYGNFNNWIYVRTAQEYGKNTLVIMSRYPQYFAERFVNSVYIFFGFANYRYFDETEKWMVFDGSTLHKAYQAAKYFVLPALLAVLFFFILWRLWKDRKNLVSLFILFNLMYVFGVANVVELGENDTARVPIDPLIIISAVYTIALVRRNRPGNTLV
jgi:hypothetical protein